MMLLFPCKAGRVEAELQEATETRSQLDTNQTLAQPFPEIRLVGVLEKEPGTTGVRVGVGFGRIGKQSFSAWLQTDSHVWAAGVALGKVSSHNIRRDGKSQGPREDLAWPDAWNG